MKSFAMGKALFNQIMEFKLTILDQHKNDLGQHITFVEHPTMGEEGGVIAVFPRFCMAFNTEFFDTEDMTATYHSIGFFLDSEDEDMGYVPRLLDGKFQFKFESEL